jgi:hypothetical protein
MWSAELGTKQQVGAQGGFVSDLPAMTGQAQSPPHCAPSWATPGGCCNGACEMSALASNGVSEAGYASQGSVGSKYARPGSRPACHVMGAPS